MFPKKFFVSRLTFDFFRSNFAVGVPARRLPPIYDYGVITGFGRSGTDFLSSLFTQNGVTSLHEPDRADVMARIFFQRGNHMSDKYISHIKSRFISERLEAHSKFVEVNSYLRFFVKDLRHHLQIPVVVVYRCGADVVRSMMGRILWEPYYYSGPQWAKFLAEKNVVLGRDRFSDCCACWAYDMWVLREQLDDECLLLDFASVVSDTENIYRKICAKFHLDCTKDTFVLPPKKNSTKKFAMPIYREWSDAQKQLYDRICGAEEQAWKGLLGHSC